MNNHLEFSNSFEKVVGFSFPIIKEEMGEVERVANIFDPEHTKDFIKKFIEKAEKTELTKLTEDIWSILENTDSYDIRRDDWEGVKYNAEEVGREWESKKKTMEAGVQMPAPIILKCNGKYHKVAGNTRLMIARAMGGTPEVLIVDMDTQ